MGHLDRNLDHGWVGSEDQEENFDWYCGKCGDGFYEDDDKYNDGDEDLCLDCLKEKYKDGAH